MNSLPRIFSARTFFLIQLFLTSISSAVFSQVEFNYSGYTVNLASYTFNNKAIPLLSLSNENLLGDLTRIRLRPVLQLWEGARINLEHEVNLFYSSKKIQSQLLNSLVKRQFLDMSWNFIEEEKLNGIHFIDRLYFRQGFSFGNLTIGRQRISWGTGRIWNPTDFFNPINPISYSKIEKDGADAVSLTLNFGSFTDLNLVYNREDLFVQNSVLAGKSFNNNAGAHFRTNFFEYDISLIAARVDEKEIVGLDFAGNLFDAGVRGEGILSFSEDKKKTLNFILGADYQFTAKLYALIEYLYNGAGVSEKKDYDFIRTFLNSSFNLAKDYLFTSANYIYSPLTNISISCNTNLNDGSGFVNFIYAYSLQEDLYITLGAQLTYGSDKSEYWYYPSSLFLQGEFHF